MNTKIGADALKLSTSRIISLSLSMISAMLLSRFVTLEEYGTYSQLLIASNLVTGIFILGLPSSLNYFLARAENNRDREQFLSVYYTLTTVIGFFSGLILVLSAPLIASYFNNPLITQFTYFFAVFPWSQKVISSLSNICIVFNKTLRLVLFQIINSLLLLLIIIAIRVFNLDYSTYIFLYLLVETVYAIVIILIARTFVGGLNISFDTKIIRQILNFSIPLGLASVAGLIHTEFGKILIGGFLDTEQLAIYTNAARELPVKIIGSSITAVLMPNIVLLLKKHKKVEAIKLWGDAIQVSYIFICFLAAGLFVFAPEAMTFLYSARFLPGVPVFRVYALMLLIRSTYWGMMLNSIGKTKIILYSTIISFVANIIFNILFFQLLGFIGPAIATFVTTILSMSILISMTSKVMKISFRSIIPWKNLFVITFINIGFGLVFALLKQLLPIDKYVGDIIEAILLVLIWALVYFGLSYSFIKNKWRILNHVKF